MSVQNFKYFDIYHDCDRFYKSHRLSFLGLDFITRRIFVCFEMSVISIAATTYQIAALMLTRYSFLSYLKPKTKWFCILVVYLTDNSVKYTCLEFSLKLRYCRPSRDKDFRYYITFSLISFPHILIASNKNARSDNSGFSRRDITNRRYFIIYGGKCGSWAQIASNKCMKFGRDTTTHKDIHTYIKPPKNYRICSTFFFVVQWMLG